MTDKLFGDVPLFSWKDMNGKVLKIAVFDEDDTTVIVGYQIDTGVMYIIDTEVKEKCLEI